MSVEPTAGDEWDTFREKAQELQAVFDLGRLINSAAALIGGALFGVEEILECAADHSKPVAEVKAAFGAAVTAL